MNKLKPPPEALIFKEFIKGNLIESGRFSELYSGLSQNAGKLVTIKIIKLANIIKIQDDKV